MQVGVTFEMKRLQDKLHLLARAARVEPGKVMKEEAKYLAQSLIRITPPASLGQGRAAVSADLKLVYDTPQGIYKKVEAMSFPGKAGFQAAMVRAIKKRDDAALRDLLTGPIQATESVPVAAHTRNGVSIPSYTQTRKIQRPPLDQVAGSTVVGGSLNPSLHTGRRNSRGKVKGRVLSQIVTATRSLRDYQKTIRERVGWHVAGWATLARVVGAKVPAWVARTRLETVSGTSQTNFGEKPFIRATNLDVKIPGYQRTVNDAVRFRLRITAKKLDAVLKGRAVNLGFTRIGAKK